MKSAVRFLPAVCLAGLILAVPAHAFSELQEVQMEEPEEQPDRESVPGVERGPNLPDLEVPLPDPLRPATPGAKVAEETPRVLYDVMLLPEPVRRMRESIMAACKAGDIEALRALLSTGPNATQLSLSAVVGDPIEHLKSLSGDDEGHEILAILYEVLAAGFVHLDIGTDDEIYAWPYFVALPIGDLTPPQRVELFKLVTAGDYEEMKAYGTYIFFRTGISPDGEWEFFIGGE
ncbi:hypothetical protein PZ895_12045 [Mesorhizobium sp. YIM 152430]|uniref:hypothetical protein n=1 Tax=Mesorhizobium sp. YIM 152430 TaxID=3031761 RepID=UPI0023DC2A5D|nr:hypothetical protein [Mesorhizobium sp. YIM 152430]MDF1600491.1 hypothetical protein [Mesorhizobium sp. YIM 152430]